MKATIKKVTLELPGELLEKAMHSTGKNMTETVRQGLQLVAAKEVYQELRKFRGKLKFSVKLDELRKDRNER